MHFRKTFWVTLVLLGLLYLFNQFVKDIAFTRAATVVILLIVVGYFWTRETLNSVSISRRAREFRQQAGQVFNEQFFVQNNGRMPKMWVEIIDESGLGKAHGSKFISWLKGRTRWSYATHTILEKRGIYELGPTRVIAGDPFGLFYREILFPGSEKIMVLPYYEPISTFTSPSGYLPGGKAMRIRSLEVTPYAAGVREYQSGDPLRRIDWKSSARLEKLMVKEFDQDPETNVWIFLDASSDANETTLQHPIAGSTRKEAGRPFLTPAERHQYHLPRKPFEYAVSLTASLCEYFVRNEKSVGLIMNGQGLFKLTPDLGPRQLDKLLEALSIVRPAGNISLPELLESQITPIPKGSTVIIVSASSEEGILPVVRGIKYRNYLPIYVGINKAGFGNDPDNQALIEELRASSIPVNNLNYGDPLGKLAEIQ